MNKALPKIRETVLQLKEKLNQERNSKRQTRLRALYLIASQQAKSRTRIAALLGKSRNTISNWLSLYEQEGLDKYLEIYRPEGAKTKISEAALEEIKAVLASEKGSRTYKEIHQMVVKKHGIKIHYSNVHQLVRYKLEAKAKVPRPSNPKKTNSKSSNSETQLKRSSQK